MIRGISWCAGLFIALVLTACSKDAQVGCSTPEVQTTLSEIVWERAATIADAPTTIGQQKMKLSYTGVITNPGRDGQPPTCEATVVATAGEPIPESRKLQLAIGSDPSIRRSGNSVEGHVEYQVKVTDDGKSFQVTTRHFEEFAAALAGSSEMLRIADIQSRIDPKAEAAARAASAEAAVQEIDRLAAAGTAAAPPAASAAPAPTTAAAGCGSTDSELQACAADDLAASDKKLNAAYGALRASKDEAGQKALRDAQRAWIARRDADCSEAKLGADGQGGSALVLNVLGCKREATDRRTAELVAGKV